jgi:aspartate/methionine/tyrosine aminotransferase
MQTARPMRDFALEVYLAKWEFAARYHLTASDAQSLTVGELLALADAKDREAFDALSLSYIPTYGTPELRQLIAGTYDSAKPENILCFAGAQEGIHCAMHALLEPGDHAIVAVPNYQSAETIPLHLAEVTGVPLDPDRDWTLDIDRVAAAIRPNTKLVSVNFPNNPTGKILERERFDALVDLCRHHGLWLFSDEVYRLIERDPAKRLPQAIDAYERGISLNVMSKAYGLPGLRIGWIAARDHALLERMERVKHYLSICNAVPSEALAAIALKASDRIVGRNRQIATDNLVLLERFFADYPGLFEWYVSDGGLVGFPRYLGPEGVDLFTARLVEQAGIVLLPASIYRSDLVNAPTDRFRIGFGRYGMKEALAVFRDFLRTYEN